MSQMEQRELQARKQDIALDMSELLEKYRAIFSWDIPEVDINAVDEVVLAEMELAVKHLLQARRNQKINKAQQSNVDK
ncbi:hypothetical protein ACO0K7_08620 [Undibacterium sp. Ji67W]|uniref:hypothetical protein n=1 Tax=Undibacterium sp. Ji67W TaxID=3413042 RepID=UPI003BF29FA3